MEAPAARTPWAPLAAGLGFGVVGAMLGAWAGYQASAEEFTVELGAVVPVLLISALTIVLLAIAGYLAWGHLSWVWAITGVAALVVGSLAGYALAPVHPSGWVGSSGTAIFMRQASDPSWQSPDDTWSGEWTGPVHCDRHPGSDNIWRVRGGPPGLHFTAYVRGVGSIVLGVPGTGVGLHSDLAVVGPLRGDTGAARVPGTDITLIWNCDGSPSASGAPTPPARGSATQTPPAFAPTDTPPPPALKLGATPVTACELAVVAFYELEAADEPWEAMYPTAADMAGRCTEAEFVAAEAGMITDYYHHWGLVAAICHPEARLVDPESLLCQSRVE